MTVLRSASGTRIECDRCSDHAASTSLSPDQLRRESGYVRHHDRDWCPTCWNAHGSTEASMRRPPRDDGPAAA